MSTTPSVISRYQVIASLAEDLRMPVGHSSTQGLSLPLIGQALRRAAYIMAPCPRHQLERAVCQSLVSIVPSDEPDITVRVTEALEALLAYGDLLEVKTQEAEAWALSPLVVRPAPPTFVLCKSGAAIILGVAGDDLIPLTSAANERIRWHGVLRSLAPEESENLKALLTEMGLIEISEKLWLRLPHTEAAASYLIFWQHRLSEQLIISEIDGLQIIDPRRSPNFYSGRWLDPSKNMSGMYVGRRRQRYGNPLWCVVELKDGTPKRFIDLHRGIYHERACDIAWRIQMAIDANGGTPQKLRCRLSDDNIYIEFFSPIPNWAERKLAVVGERVAATRCLFTYRVTKANANEVMCFLNDYLWIVPET